MSAPLFATAVHSFRLGWRGAWEEKWAAATALAPYGILMVLWSGIWFAVPASAMAALGLTVFQTVWYGGMAELLIFVVPIFLYQDIEAEIRSGQIVAAFTRPVRYEVLKLSAWLGQCLARFFILAPPAFMLLYLLTGQSGFHTPVQIAFPLLFLGGGIMIIQLQGIIGLCAAWLPSPRLLRMLLQKCMFIFGGLILPLSHYPDALKAIAWMTPFPALLYAPASLMIGGDAAHIVRMMGIQMFWIIVLAGLLVVLHWALEQKILRTGSV